MGRERQRVGSTLSATGQPPRGFNPARAAVRSNRLWPRTDVQAESRPGPLTWVQTGTPPYTLFREEAPLRRSRGCRHSASPRLRLPYVAACCACCSLQWLAVHCARRPTPPSVAAAVTQQQQPPHSGTFTRAQGTVPSTSSRPRCTTLHPGQTARPSPGSREHGRPLRHAASRACRALPLPVSRASPRPSLESSFPLPPFLLPLPPQPAMCSGVLPACGLQGGLHTLGRAARTGQGSSKSSASPRRSRPSKAACPLRRTARRSGGGGGGDGGAARRHHRCPRHSRGGGARRRARASDGDGGAQALRRPRVLAFSVLVWKRT